MKKRSKKILLGFVSFPLLMLACMVDVFIIILMMCLLPIWILIIAVAAIKSDGYINKEEVFGLIGFLFGPCTKMYLHEVWDIDRLL